MVGGWKVGKLGDFGILVKKKRWLLAILGQVIQQLSGDIAEDDGGFIFFGLFLMISEYHCLV